MRVDSTAWLRVAGSWLVLAGVLHSWFHFIFYEKIGDFSIGRRALYEYMRAYDVSGGMPNPFGSSMWTMLSIYSISMSLLLLFAGLVTLMIAGVRDDRFKRGFALFSCVFWIAAVIVWMWLAPMIEQLIVATGASLLYAMAWVRLR